MIHRYKCEKIAKLFNLFASFLPRIESWLIGVSILLLLTVEDHR